MVADARGGLESITEATADVEDIMGEKRDTASGSTLSGNDAAKLKAAKTAKTGSPTAKYGYGLTMGLYPSTIALDVFGPIPRTADARHMHGSPSPDQRPSMSSQAYETFMPEPYNYAQSQPYSSPNPTPVPTLLQSQPCSCR